MKVALVTPEFSARYAGNEIEDGRILMPVEDGNGNMILSLSTSDYMTDQQMIEDFESLELIDYAPKIFEENG